MKCIRARRRGIDPVNTKRSKSLEPVLLQYRRCDYNFTYLTIIRLYAQAYPEITEIRAVSSQAQAKLGNIGYPVRNARYIRIPRSEVVL